MLPPARPARKSALRRRKRSRARQEQHPSDLPKSRVALLSRKVRAQLNVLPSRPSPPTRAQQLPSWRSENSRSDRKHDRRVRRSSKSRDSSEGKNFKIRIEFEGEESEEQRGVRKKSIEEAARRAFHRQTIFGESFEASRLEARGHEDGKCFPICEGCDKFLEHVTGVLETAKADEDFVEQQSDRGDNSGNVSVAEALREFF